MREFSDTIQQILSLSSLSTYFCVKIDFSTGPLLHTTLPYDVAITNLGDFTADNNLINVEAPRMSSVVDRETYKIVYSDPTFYFRESFEEGVIGTKMIIYIGFLNTADYAINGTEPGHPFTYFNYNPALSDVIIAYSGVIDSHGYTQEDDQISVVLEGSSPMASLDLVKLFMSSQESLQKIDPTDTAFNQVHIGSTAVSILWGKE